MFVFLSFIDTFLVYVDAIDTSIFCVDIFQFYRHILRVCRSYKHSRNMYKKLIFLIRPYVTCSKNHISLSRQAGCVGIF